MDIANESKGKIVGLLSSEEKVELIKQTESTIKNYKIGFILSLISIVIIVGLIAAPAMYVAIRKQQKKLDDIRAEELMVHEIEGVLSRKSVGKNLNQLYAYKIDGNMFSSEVITANDKSGIQNHLGEVITFQYIPSISKNRSYSDTNGHGYNFITKLSLS